MYAKVFKIKCEEDTQIGATNAKRVSKFYFSQNYQVSCWSTFCIALQAEPLQYNTQHFKFDQICFILRISHSSKYGRGAGRLDISPDCKGSNFTRAVSGERSRALLYKRGYGDSSGSTAPSPFTVHWSAALGLLSARLNQL